MQAVSRPNWPKIGSRHVFAFRKRKNTFLLCHLGASMVLSEQGPLSLLMLLKSVLLIPCSIWVKACASTCLHGCQAMQGCLDEAYKWVAMLKQQP
eukprot:770021-Amphidinium_carterae.1